MVHRWNVGLTTIDIVSMTIEIVVWASIRNKGKRGQNLSTSLLPSLFDVQVSLCFSVVFPVLRLKLEGLRSRVRTTRRRRGERPFKKLRQTLEETQKVSVDN